MKRFIAAVALSMGFAAGALAQGFPDKTVTIIVPYPPGGGVDIMVRAVAAELTQKWGKPVIIDNKAGAGTLIGADAVQRAKPDGYTLLATVDQTIVANRYLFKKLPYDPDKSFIPITMMAESPQFLIAKSELPAKDLKELVALAKREKGTLTYGSYGEGSWPVLVYSTLNEKRGTDLQHIPYKGVAPMLTAIVSGEVDVATGSASVAGEMLKAKRMKALAIAANKRAPQFPDVPTTSEQGFPELQATVWYGLFAPAETPPPVVNKIQADVAAILKTPEFTEKQGTARGLSIVASSSEEFAKRIADDVKATQEMVRAAKIVPQ